MKIHAIADLSIKAALESPEMRHFMPALRAQRVNIDRKLSVKELDEKLAGKSLSTAQRIALKAAMSRAGLLA